MFDKLKHFFFGPENRGVINPSEIQPDINRIVFKNIYEAEELSQHMGCSFVANIRGTQEWRVYPDRRPKLVYKMSKQ